MMKKHELVQALKAAPMAGRPNKIHLALVLSRRTQTEVARAAGLHNTLVCLIANGNREPNDEHRKAIAGALGLPTDVLFPSEAA